MSFTLTLRRALVVALSLLSASVLVGASPAAAAEPTIALKAGAAVQARGAALVVDVVVTCPAGINANLFGRASQRLADKTLAGGAGGQPVRCTGAPQTRRVALGASNQSVPFGPAKPFAVGPAFVSVVLTYCIGDTCRELEAQRTVHVTAVTVDAARFTSSTVTVTLPATAELEAVGAGVTVSIPYRCTAGRSGTFGASFLQRTSRAGVTGSFDTLTATCTGLSRTGVLAFHAEAAAWRAGPAFVVLFGDVCNRDSCQGISAHRTLTVV